MILYRRDVRALMKAHTIVRPLFCDGLCKGKVRVIHDVCKALVTESAIGNCAPG